MEQTIRGMIFKIELIDVTKPIWRRFVVPRDISFRKFQEVIQIVMGWKKVYPLNSQSNGFSFSFGTEEFGYFMDMSRKDALCELDNFMIDDYFPKHGACGQYEFNFDAGGWSHVLVLEDYCTISGNQKYLCFEGEMACPPTHSWPSAYNKLYDAKITKNTKKEDIFLQSEKNKEESHFDFDAAFVYHHWNFNLHLFNRKTINDKLGRLK